MKEDNIKRRTAFAVLAIMLLIAIIAGATYAYFAARGNTESKTVTTVSLGLQFDDDTATILATDIIPITTDKVLTDTKNVAKKSFKIMKKENSKDLYTTISLTDITISENLAKYDFKWALYQDDNTIATGYFGGKTS